VLELASPRGKQTDGVCLARKNELLQSVSYGFRLPPWTFSRSWCNMASVFEDDKNLRRCFMKYAKRMLALALVSLPILAVAQMTSSTRVVGQVPFPFMVGNKHVPAGRYTVEPANNSGRILAIQGVGARVGLFTPAMPTVAKKASGSYALVFHKYGDKAFLTSIKLAGDRTVYEIPESRAEAELRAQNVTATEEILLASAR
jgi:hypothetical protein